MDKKLEDIAKLIGRKEEDEAFTEKLGDTFGFGIGSLTNTGAIWCFMPWLLLLKKRLNFTLLELMGSIIFLGVSTSACSTRMFQQGFSQVAVLVLLYAALHFHSMALIAALYHWKRRWGKADAVNAPPRWRWVFAYQSVPSFLFLWSSWLLAR